MGITIEIDPREIAKMNLAMNRIAELTGQTLRIAIPEQMRLLAADLAFNTSPKGKDRSSGDANQKSVRSRIMQVYPPVGVVVNMIKKKNEGAAGLFANSFDKRNYAKAQKIINSFLPEMNITISGFDGGALHRQQSNQKKVTKRILAKGYGRVNAYANRKARRVGYAKGGFATAARQLGGVRGIPGFATRQKAPGTGMVTGDGKTLTVTMINHVRHIRSALKVEDEQRAVSFRMKQLTKRLENAQTKAIRRASRGMMR